MGTTNYKELISQEDSMRRYNLHSVMLPALFSVLFVIAPRDHTADAPSKKLMVLTVSQHLQAMSIFSKFSISIRHRYCKHCYRIKRAFT
jgi:hypothetical protein